MADKEVNITYESLFEILRLEKNREELQKLSETFFQDVVDYLKEKQAMLENEKKNSVLSFDDEKKNERQIFNIKSFIKEIYEKRERKIISLALNKSRTSSSIIDSSALLPEEKMLFDELVCLLNKARNDIVFNILNAKLPDFNILDKAVSKEPAEQEQKKEGTAIKTDMLIRFIHPVPRFVGPELEIYGPFEAEDIAKLPAEIANVLINKSRAEEIKEE